MSQKILVAAVAALALGATAQAQTNLQTFTGVKTKGISLYRGVR